MPGLGKFMTGVGETLGAAASRATTHAAEPVHAVEPAHVAATYENLVDPATRIAAADETVLHLRALDDLLAPVQDALESALMSRGERKAAGLPHGMGDRKEARKGAAALFDSTKSTLYAGVQQGGLAHKVYGYDSSMATWERMPPVQKIASRIRGIGGRGVIGHPSERWSTGTLRRDLARVTDVRQRLRTAQAELPVWARYGPDDAAARHIAARGGDSATDTETSLRLAEVLDGPDFADDVNGVVPHIFQAMSTRPVRATVADDEVVVGQIERRARALVERIEKVKYDDNYGSSWKYDSGWDSDVVFGPIGPPWRIRHELRDLAVLAGELGERGTGFHEPLRQAEALLERQFHPMKFRRNQEELAASLRETVRGVLSAVDQTAVRKQRVIEGAIRAPLQPAREIGAGDHYASLLEQQRLRLGD
jgi:hypothetical protein